MTVRLLDVTTGQIVWAHTIDLRDTNVFAVQDAIAEEVASALVLRLTGEERSQLTRHHTASIEAYQLYLQGRHYWHRYPADGYENSRGCFERAIDADPGYAHAYVGLAYYFSFGAANGLLRPADAWPAAEAANATALKLDDSVSEAYNVLASQRLYIYRDWPGAERAFRRGIELSPGDAETRNHYGRCLILVGRVDEALAEVRHALRLDPLSPVLTRGSVRWTRQVSGSPEPQRSEIN